MTVTIMSEDILGICLLVSGGDLKMKLGDAIKRVEEFQAQNDRYFGITDTDFHTLFWRLLWEKFPGSLLLGESESNLYKVNLQDVALDILKYGDAFFMMKARVGTSTIMIRYLTRLHITIAAQKNFITDRQSEKP